MRQHNKAFDDATATALAAGPAATTGTATTADPATATEISELETTIRCGKKHGLDVAALEAKLQALQTPPAVKALSVGQAKHAATALEQQHRRQCEAVAAAQENLVLQEAKVDELAIKFAEACALRDVLIEQDYRATQVGKAPLEVPKSQLHVGKILAGEQVQLVYDSLFIPNDVLLNGEDLEHLRNFEASTQAGIQAQFLSHFQTFQATMAAEAAKVQAEATARAAKRKRANEENQDAADADAANKNVLPPTATPPTQLSTDAPAPEAPKTVTATPVAATGESAPQSSGSQASGGTGATDFHAAQAEARDSRTLSRREENTGRHCRSRSRRTKEANARHCNRCTR